MVKQKSAREEERTLTAVTAADEMREHDIGSGDYFLEWETKERRTLTELSESTVFK